MCDYTSGLVSVVVPVYNVAKYISKCLDSILSQIYTKLEVIVVNDESSDNSEDIIKKYKEKDNRVKYVFRKNGGLGAARNTGLKHATGEFICFIDSDDWIREDYIKLLVEQLVADGSDIAICNMVYVFPDGRRRKRTPHIDKTECIDCIEALKREFIGKQYRFHVPNKFCKRSLYYENRIFFPEKKFYEDVGTTYKIILRAGKISLLNEALYFYRQNRIGSIMYTKAEPKRFIDMFDILSGIMKSEEISMLHIEKEIQSLYLTNIISMVNYIYPIEKKMYLREYSQFKRCILEDKSNEEVKGFLKNDTLSRTEKGRIFLIYYFFDFYCWLMKCVDYMRCRRNGITNKKT